MINKKQMRDINRFRNGRAQGGGRPHGNNRGVDRYGRHIREMNESRGFDDRGGRYGRPFGSRRPDDRMADRYGSGDRYLNESRFGDGVSWESSRYMLKDLSNADDTSKRYIRNNKFNDYMFAIDTTGLRGKDAYNIVDYVTTECLNNNINKGLVIDVDNRVLGKIRWAGASYSGNRTNDISWVITGPTGTREKHQQKWDDLIDLVSDMIESGDDIFILPIID